MELPKFWGALVNVISHIEAYVTAVTNFLFSCIVIKVFNLNLLSFCPLQKTTVVL